MALNKSLSAVIDLDVDVVVVAAGCAEMQVQRPTARDCPQAVVGEPIEPLGHTLEGGEPGNPYVPDARLAGQFGDQVGLGILIAVSYTHLRAHETDSYLV